MKSRSRRAHATKCRALLASGFVIFGLALPGVPARTADAQEKPDLTTVTALAVASGQRASLSTSGSAAISDFFDGVGPVAESRFDGLGGGQSLASFPYPGTTIQQYPAYVALAAEGQEVPGYPFFVAAHPGQPEATQSDPTGTYLLEAKAGMEMASSLARLRASGGENLEAGSVSTTSIKMESGKLVATAESLTDGLTVGALRIGSVYSKSVTTYVPGDQEPQTTTELRIDALAVNDQRFGFGPDGLTVTQEGVPVPVSEGIEALNALVKQDGISIRFLDPEEIAGGAQARTFEVSATRELPGGGTGVLRAKFGQASTAIVPGGDFLASLPLEEEPSDFSGVSPPAQEQEQEQSPEAAAADDILSESQSVPASEDPTFEAGLFGDLNLPTSWADPGGGYVDAATGELPAGADMGTQSPEVALVTPPLGGQDVRGGGRLAAAPQLLAVDGVYAAVAWATIAVLALSLIWRQGARKWTS